MRHGPPLLALALAASACRSAPPPKAPPPVSNATVGDAARWTAIEALAKPTHVGPPSEPLGRALVDGDVAALVQWLRESGTLRVPNRDHLDPFKALELGRKAIDAATATDWEPVAAGSTLGLYLVLDGASFTDAELGLELLETAVAKLKALGDPPGGLDLPASTDLVRVVAAEAVFSRKMYEAADTPEMRVQMTAMFGDPHVIDSLTAFWPAALDGARRGEPAATTVARMRAAATKIGRSEALLQMIIRTAEDIARQLAALERVRG